MRQGRNFAFWKREVTDMLRDACASWLGDFRMDGLRFDSANDLPPQTVQAMTWAMRERFPGRILTAEARSGRFHAETLDHPVPLRERP